MAGRGITLTYHGSPCLADFFSDPLEDRRERERETSLSTAVRGVTGVTVLSPTALY